MLAKVMCGNAQSAPEIKLSFEKTIHTHCLRPCCVHQQVLLLPVVNASASCHLICRMSLSDITLSLLAGEEAGL